MKTRFLPFHIAYKRLAKNQDKIDSAQFRSPLLSLNAIYGIHVDTYNSYLAGKVVSLGEYNREELIFHHRDLGVAFLINKQLVKYMTQMKAANYTGEYSGYGARRQAV